MVSQHFRFINSYILHKKTAAGSVIQVAAAVHIRMKLTITTPQC
ncbi:MAG TPA: hypothetical protein VGN87_07185 [Paenibacillus sp.]